MKYNFLTTYPFSGIVGQEKAKKAIILAVINPQIKGVLLVGEKGTAKSTLIRSLGEILDKDIINLPLNITEDRLVGSLNLASAIKYGKRKFEPGIFKLADENILYVDEINLLSDQIVNVLTQTIAQGENIVEREGISYSHIVNTTLIGSMNPEEGKLRTQLLDKFGIYVEVKGEQDIELRKEIIKRRLEFEANPEIFCGKYIEKNNKTREHILNSKKILNHVKISRENIEFAVKLVCLGGCHGHRGEIVLVETAKAIAAYDNRTIVNERDIEEAARYTLPHRIKESINIEDKIDKKSDEVEIEENDQDEKQQANKEEDRVEEFIDKNNSNIDLKTAEKRQKAESIESDGEKLETIETINKNISIVETKDKIKSVLGSGKRSKVKSNSKKGRYIKYKMPKQRVEDISIYGTLRVAALKQKNREKEGSNIKILKEDIRVKVREKRIGASILFVVDSSGSMGAKKRMGAVKGAILSLLTEAYEKRDKVGLITFRKDRAEVLLDITRSVELAKKSLETMKTGGKTPLAHGLDKGYEILKVEKIKNPGVLQYLVLVSDGKGNIPYKGKDSFEETIKIAQKIRYEGINTLVIDTQNGYIEYPFAKQISEKMEGEYIRLNNISKEEINEQVKKLVKL